jgi:hypothetical protein
MSRTGRTAGAILGMLLTPGPALAQGLDPVPFLERLKSDGARDRVLNQMEIATRYFWAGSMKEAAPVFDLCIRDIETVFLNDASVTKARSLWYEEGAKTFKGEPYERAMVYYYRGLIFLRDADYENARAAFRQGTMQDAFAEEEQNQADFALLYFLEAWASHLNGDKDLRDETLARLKKLRPDFPGIAADDDTLVLAETGAAPRKLGDGANHSYFVYRRGKGFKENRAVLQVGEERRTLYPIEDIFWQASTRGGREIDQILEGDVGSTLTDGATALSALGGSAGLAGGMGAIGAIASLISMSAKARADTRAWGSLPDRVHVATFNGAKLGTSALTLRYMVDDADSDLAPASIIFTNDARGRRFALLRSR